MDGRNLSGGRGRANQTLSEKKNKLMTIEIVNDVMDV